MSTVEQRVDEISNNTNLSMETEVTSAKLESTGMCRLNCKFCYNSTMMKNDERQRFITEEDFNLMIDALDKLGSIKEVGMFYMGESLYHPNLAHFYKVLKEKGYFTFLTTNAVVFKQEEFDEIVKYVDSVKVSWNYRDYDDFYEKTGQPKKLYDKMKSNLVSIYLKCNEMEKQFTVSTVLDKGKIPEDYKDNLPIDCERYYMPVQSQCGVYKPGKPGVVGEYYKQFSPPPCWSLFRGFYVDCELNVRTCAYGHMPEHILMNLKDGFSKEKYYSLKKRYMKDHLSGKIPNICKNCITV